MIFLLIGIFFLLYVSPYLTFHRSVSGGSFYGPQLSASLTFGQQILRTSSKDRIEYGQNILKNPVHTYHGTSPLVESGIVPKTSWSVGTDVTSESRGRTNVKD